MSRGIDDVDLDAVIIHRCILGENRDAALSLNIVGIHDAIHNLLIGAEHAALPQQLVHERGLAVVNMGDDCDVSHIRSRTSH